MTAPSASELSGQVKQLLRQIDAIPTDEELLIARDTVRVIRGVPHPS